MSVARETIRPAKPRKPRIKSCEVCSDPYEVRRLGQRVCGDYKCAIELGKIIAQAAQLKRARKAKREWRQKAKTLSKVAQETQREVNKWIRWRDRNDDCISCGKPASAPGQWHASHYRSTGAAPELRFDEDNIHKSCAKCNDWLSGNIGPYRARLIQKIGVERVERLEGPHAPMRYRKEDLIEIRRRYVARLREEMKSEMQG